MAGHKYWALTNITVRNNSDAKYLREVSRLGFVTKSGTLSNNPANIFASSILNPSSTETYYPSNALDDNIKTVFASKLDNNPNNGLGLRIWYVFDTAEEVTHIQIQHRSLTFNREWQTADVEYSDDGINWVKFGYIEPKIAYQDTQLKTVGVKRYQYISGNSKQDDGIASRFVLISDWQTGDFIAKVTPQANGDWEYISPNSNKLIVSHVGAEGFAPKIDAPITPALV